MVWAGITALLRDRFNANEILVSLMLVYVAVQVLSWLVGGPWKDPMGFNFPQTKTFFNSFVLASASRPKSLNGVTNHHGDPGRLRKSFSQIVSRQ
jgi:ABC-type uncharacterized transport system permease subunit